MLFKRLRIIFPIEKYCFCFCRLARESGLGPNLTSTSASTYRRRVLRLVAMQKSLEHKSLELDLRGIQSELRHNEFVRISDALGPTEGIFRAREHGQYRRIDDFIFLYVQNFEVLQSHSIAMARGGLICIQITIKGSYQRCVGEHVERVNPAQIQITNCPRSISETAVGAKFRGIMIACDRQYFLDHFGLRPDNIPALYKPIFLTDVGMADALRLPPTPSIITTTDQIISCRYEEPLKTMYLKAKTIEIICDVVAQLNGLALRRAIRLRSAESKAQAIKTAAAIYRREIHNQPTIKQMALRVGLNHNELTIGFRELFGATPHAYAQMVRMEEARDLLSAGQLSISEIARRVGYEGYSSFSRAYHMHYGRAPSLIEGRDDG
ncbi:AraC family transcriptional regulator [Rhizobium calliandrae]|uniref:AraC family transcriptional regulator n=1 Tax=Rhizobium calliandrae TaxID=1312182 RepID=A0ABT7KD27_9HYPH|nr:AraC family transcriptional regulator [Rhizobium calliandrae]MDL2405890.1 AraC family transcriptional regulator [Rhizobium calliandrae]